MKYSYGYAFKLNMNLGNAHNIPMECFRQWLVLIGSGVAIPLLCLCTSKIKKFNKAFTLDTLLLIMEIVKVGPQTLQLISTSYVYS